MYTMAQVIYGIPITRKMDEWFQKNEDTLDLEELGFELPYSGNGDYIRGFLGALLATMDEIEPVPLTTDADGNIVGLVSELSPGGEVKEAHSLKPTAEQVKEFREAFGKLPAGLKRVCPAAGIYITWSTS